MPFQPGQSGNPDKQFQPGQSGNPAGKPKGAIHLSTRIQNLLNDDSFTPEQLGGYKGTPAEAITRAAIKKAVEGDNKWADWLAKYGYGQKFEVEHSGEIATGENNTELAKKFADYLKTDIKEKS